MQGTGPAAKAHGIENSPTIAGLQTAPRGAPTFPPMDPMIHPQALEILHHLPRPGKKPSTAERYSQPARERTQASMMPTPS